VDGLLFKLLTLEDHKIDIIKLSSSSSPSLVQMSRKKKNTKTLSNHFYS